MSGYESQQAFTDIFKAILKDIWIYYDFPFGFAKVFKRNRSMVSCSHCRIAHVYADDMSDRAEHHRINIKNCLIILFIKLLIFDDIINIVYYKSHRYLQLYF